MPTLPTSAKHENSMKSVLQYAEIAVSNRAKDYEDIVDEIGVNFKPGRTEYTVKDLSDFHKLFRQIASDNNVPNRLVDESHFYEWLENHLGLATVDELGDHYKIKMDRNRLYQLEQPDLFDQPL